MPQLMRECDRKVQRSIQLSPMMLGRVEAIEKNTGCRLNRLLEASVLAFCEILTDQERAEAMRRAAEQDNARRSNERAEPSSQ